jgi:TM2 domain-containing membrane protein YozV
MEIAPTKQMPFCPSCGKEVKANEAFCWSCGAQLPPRGQPSTLAGSGYPAGRPQQAKPRNGYLALLLSFVFPGLGQYYSGEKKKGRLFIVVGIALALTTLVEVGLILYPLFWVYNMIDEFLVVRTASAGPPSVWASVPPANA